MARLTLHIGHPKTGSTSIQHTLRENRALLEQHGHSYPPSGTINFAHHILYLLTYDDVPKSSSALLRMGRNLDDARRAARPEWDALVRHATALPDHDVILSSELMFRTLQPDDGPRLRRLLDPMRREVRVLAYLRTPTGRYLSQVQQMLKSSRKLVQPFRSSYTPQLRSYRAAFGTAPETRVFDRRLLKAGDVVDDFLGWTGLDAIPGLVKVNDVNVSLSAEAMAVLARLGAERPPETQGDRRRARALRKVVSRLDATLPNPTRPRLNEALADRINRSCQDLLPLRDEFGITFPDVDYATAGRAEARDLLPITSIDEICAHDPARAAALERAALRETSSFLGRLRAMIRS
jgi:hypothetical protein